MKTSRRHFLSTSAFAGAFAFSPPLARAASPNGDLRVCVIGFHGRGKNLAEDVMKCKGTKLVALCDVDSKVMDAYAAELDKKGVKIQQFEDYRKACESKDIDAVVIATPNHTHALIGVTAAANGKHAYVEKPVSHNVWEGRQLPDAAKKYKTIIQHGFQRRSEPAWYEAAEYIQSGELGKMTLARGLCYKPRPSIGKVSSPQELPASVNYNLWSGPRELMPVQRTKFHYDWHWQLPYGNGDLGNQAPHQLDVCRWMIGSPTLPVSTVSVGARLGYEDDGDWANTQFCYYDYKPVPVLFEVRGLPSKPFKGESIGNIIECEGGHLAGGHNAQCTAYDKDGKKLKVFKGGNSHMQAFVDSCHSGKIDEAHGIESGHISSALAHIGNISWKLGEPSSPEAIKDALIHAASTDALERTLAHLEENGVDPTRDLLSLGKTLTLDPTTEQFTGEFAESANLHLKGTYRSEFELPI